jgi:hypothetical protein
MSKATFNNEIEKLLAVFEQSKTTPLSFKGTEICNN